MEQGTPIAHYDYTLPEELIAEHPIEPRDHARLLVVNRQNKTIDHAKFFNIIDHLKKGDVLVLNKTKVFRARLSAHVRKNIPLEIVLLHEVNHENSTTTWRCLARKLRRLRVGDIVHFEGADANVVAVDNTEGTADLQFEGSKSNVFHLCDRAGSVPLPPYIHNEIEDLNDYQTVYAGETGSVAAPTAGLHFTDQLLDALKNKGIQIEYLILHVGLGTFQPMWFDTIEEHKMHAEYIEIEPDVAERINAAKNEDRRIIAVGTTTTRALESVAKNNQLPIGYKGKVNIFIRPGYAFQIIDGLITNFHLPRTTLLVLVSAFAGDHLRKRAYEEAIHERYRFYSFGDAMLIL